MSPRSPTNGCGVDDMIREELKVSKSRCKESLISMLDAFAAFNELIYEELFGFNSILPSRFTTYGVKLILIYYRNLIPDYSTISLLRIEISKETRRGKGEVLWVSS